MHRTIQNAISVKIIFTPRSRVSRMIRKFCPLSCPIVSRHVAYIKAYMLK